MTGQERDKKRSAQHKLLPELEAAPQLERPKPTKPEVTPSFKARFRKEHSDFASFHEGYTRHYIAFADTKAGIIFALTGGIIGYLLNDDEIRAQIIEPCYSFEFIIISITFLSLSSVAALAFFVIAPNLFAQSSEGLVFFGAVARKVSSDDYLAEIAASSDEQLVEARLKHCFDTATVCFRKYQRLKAAIWLTPLSLVFALILLLAN